MTTRALLSGMHEMIAGGEYYLWDPLATVLALRPELGTTERRTIDVVTDGPESGRTTDAATGAAAEIFASADGRAAEAALLEGLAGADVPAIAENPDVVIDPVACTTDGTIARSGPNVLHLDAPDDTVVAIGTLEAGKTVADIEAYLAAPTEDEPAWFAPVTMLGGADGMPATDLAVLEPGTYTAVCLEGTWDAWQLRGSSTFTVRR